MIGREFVKRLRLLQGRSETIKTRFELNNGTPYSFHACSHT